MLKTFSKNLWRSIAKQLVFTSVIPLGSSAIFNHIYQPIFAAFHKGVMFITKNLTVTVGVGGTITVEQEFKQRYGEKCKIFGIEPSADQTIGYEKYGTPIHKAVGTYL